MKTNPRQQQQVVAAEYQHVVFKEKAHKELLRGAEILAKAVSSTMGPSGHSIIIDNDIGGPSITKDGVTVAKAINLRDRLQSMGAELLKEVANKTNELAGDGSTTAVVIAHALFKDGNKMIATGRSSIDLKKGMDMATDIVLKFLKENCIPVSGKKDIINVGTISSNGDKEIGDLIADAIDAVGTDGLITIEPAKSVKTSLRLAEGIQIDSGFISPFFITNSEKQICEFENPYVLITANKISSLKDILPILEKIDTAKKPLLIVADDVEGEALHTLVVNKTKGIIKVCAIKAPSYGEYRADILSDLGTVVNGVVLGATSELSLENIQLEKLGNCKKVIVNRNNCTFLMESRDEETTQRIQKRVNTIREALKNDTTLDELRINKFRERLAKLSGGIAVIQVGGSTEVEILEKKDRVEDAVNATQAATQEGIIPGGGVALFYVAQHLRSMVKAGFFADQNEDIVAGVQLIANVCETPFRTIIENSGESADVIADRLKQNWSERKVFSVDIKNLDKDSIKEFTEKLEKEVEEINNSQERAEFGKELHQDLLENGFTNKIKEKLRNNEYNIDKAPNKFNFGYNVVTQEFGNLIDLGVIDPAKVAKFAILHATSVVGLTLVCNAVVVNEEIE